MKENSKVVVLNRKFDTTKDPLWERLEVERNLLNDEKWPFIMALSEEYKYILNNVSVDMYYLEYFYKFRYIEIACKIYPNLEGETKNNSMLEVMNWIDAKYDQESKETGHPKMIAYDIFKRDQKRKLVTMLNALIGEDVTKSIMKDERKKFRFGLLEFKIFSFLVDTYDHQNAKYLRKKKYTCMTEDYYSFLKYGVTILAHAHSILGDPQIIINSWHYDAQVSHDHLNNEIAKLKKAVDKAVDLAYKSDYSNLHLDYLADMITNVTNSIKEVFEIK